MREALRNFVLAVFAIGCLLALGWIIVSSRALSKPEPHPFPHAFLNLLDRPEKPLVIAYRGLSSQAPPNSKLAFEKAAALGPNVVLWVDARPSASGTWMAWTHRSLIEDTDGTQWIAAVKDDDLAKIDAAYKFSLDGGRTFPFRGQGFHVETLKTILTAFPDRFFVVNLQDYQEGDKERIVQVIQHANAEQRVLIASPEDGILRDLREAQPTWVFGTSRAQVTRLIMLSQLFLAPSAPMRGDVFVWDPTLPLSRLNERMWTEVQRRKMKTVIAVDDSALGLEWAKRADAIVTSTPEKFVGH